MTAPLVQIDNLTYHFGRGTPTLQDLSMQVPEGSIYGFLGPNGAGKTTTLRLLLGLLQNQKGNLQLFGKSLATDRLSILRQLGSLIEQPSLYGQLTARENLEIYRRVYGVDKARIDAVLKRVELDHTGSKKAKQFSLGMKQRLSIAIALLHQPKLLVLDEPTNGLDPAGIVETRELIKKLNKEEGVTVLVSSHLLNEIERMATHVGIIHHGKKIFEGTLTELHNRKAQSTSLILETSDNAAAAGLLAELPIQLHADHLTLATDQKSVAATAVHTLSKAGIDVYRLQPQTFDLESLFIDMTA